MKFKTILVAIFAMFTMLFPAFAAGSTNSATSPFKANEFSLVSFGTYQASGAVTGDSKWGAGLQADYFVTQNFGVALATTKNTFDSGAFFQNLSIAPVARLPFGGTGFAPYVTGGVGFDFDNGNDRFYFAGAGVEYRPQFSWAPDHARLFTDVQYQWRDYLPGPGRDATLVRAGLRWTF